MPKNKFTEISTILLTIILSIFALLYIFDDDIAPPYYNAYSDKETIELEEKVDSLVILYENNYRRHEDHFYPDDIYFKLIDKGMPDSLAYMFTQVAVKESGYGLNSQVANKQFNYWGLRDRSDHTQFACFDSRDEAIDHIAKYNNCPTGLDRYKWLKDSLKWCPGCDNGEYYNKVKAITF